MEDEIIKLSSAESKLLVRCRLDMEQEFSCGKRKKSVLWGKVLDKIKTEAPDLTATKEQLQRKFLNMLATYKRIKKRNRSTGRDATTWDFFNDFDEVYGNRHSVDPPSENLQNSLDLPSCSTAEHIRANEMCREDNDVVESVSDVRGNQQNFAKKKRTVSGNETLEFLKKESEEEKLRHREVMTFEREKLEFEKEKAKIMLGLKEVLDKFLQK
ncbi:uncharacterized protein LOC120779736 [Bactrocera tryoni]|uniref:uncharacterized protein LOC120779736 n=1 Tax=Bactrocera tryoni TaxID=59916 RepID=UPI001A97947E|nr:uncharacterized protein LOC120779736 [Bactrocera tryoni]